MKHIFVLFLLVFCLNGINAQTEWLFLQGDEHDDEGSGIVIDSKDYIYVVGSFEGTVDFDPGTNDVEEYSSSEINFLQKFDEHQNLIWVKTFEGGAILDMHIDENDNIYLGGYFTGTGFGLTSSNSSDGVVVKLNDDGEILWAKSIIGIDIQQVKCVTTDSNGDLYLTGMYREDADLDPSSTGSDIHSYSGDFQGFNSFIAKWNTDGEHIWGKSYQSANCSGTEIVVDSQFDIYAAGYYKGTMDIDGGNEFIESNRTAHYIIKLDSSLNMLWSKSGEGEDIGLSQHYSSVLSLALDLQDNLYIGGVYKGIIDLGYGDTLISYTNESPYTDVFIQRMTPNGELTWTKTFGDDYIDYVFDIKVSPLGKLYSTGAFTDTVEFSSGNPESVVVSHSRDIYLMSWESEDASFNWVETYGGMCDYSQGVALAYMPNGDVYGTGEYNGSIETNQGSIYGFGDNDCIVYKVGGTTDIEEEDDPEIVIVPNPVSTTLRIEGIHEGAARLYSSTGKLVRSFSLSPNQTYDFSKLHQGIYHLHLNLGNESKVKKLIKN